MSGGGGKGGSMAAAPHTVAEAPKPYAREQATDDATQNAREAQLQKASAAMGQENGVPASPFGPQQQASQQQKTFPNGENAAFSNTRTPRDQLPWQDLVRNPESKIVNLDPAISPLTRNPAEYTRLEGKYPHSKDMIYHENAVKKVREARSAVRDAAWKANVPPEAVAAAMLDENTAINRRARGVLDDIQDTAIAGQLAGITYAGISQYLKDNPDESTSERSFLNMKMWDIGPYNLNVAYGAELFQKHVLDPKAKGPLKDITLADLPPNATVEQKWNAFRDKCLLDYKGGAYVAAELLKEGRERLAPYMKNRTPEEQAALLVTYFKQGWRTMKGRYDARLAREKIQSDMAPGEGARMFHNIKTIRDILE